MGIVWSLPIRAVQAAGMLLLLKTKLPLRTAPRRILVAAGIVLTMAEFAALDVLDAPAFLSAILFVALNCTMGLACFAGLRGLCILWCATGCTALFLAHFAAATLTTCIGLAAQLETLSFLLGLLRMTLEAGMAAGVLAPLCCIRCTAIEIPSGFVDFSATACALVSMLTGWSVSVLEAAKAGTPLLEPAVAMCVGLGLVSIAFVLLLQRLGRYYANQTQMRLAVERARMEDNARLKREELIRRWHHDEKQHISILSSLADQEDLAGVRAYLGELRSSSVRESPEFVTGNAYLDALLREKASICLERGIELRVQIQNAALLPLSGPEIGIVVGNALDNAIEACAKLEPERSAFIELQLSCADGWHMLSVANTADGQYELDDENLRTSKTAANHGIGLRQIEETAKKAGGFTQIRMRPSMFRLTVYLPERRPENDYPNSYRG